MTARQKISNKVHNEKGQALMLTLILLGVGGLIIAPLMGFMSTGLIVGQAFDEEMKEFYAADAGIEYGLWHIINLTDDLPRELHDSPLSLMADVNGMRVEVTIELVTVSGPAHEEKEFKIRSIAGTEIVVYVRAVWGEP